MKKLCEFEIPNWEDRNNLCKILATSGYLVCVEERHDYSRSFPYNYYVVVVYGKGKTDGSEEVVVVYGKGKTDGSEETV